MRIGEVQELIEEIAKRDSNADLFAFGKWIRITMSRSNESLRCWLTAQGFIPADIKLAMVKKIS